MGVAARIRWCTTHRRSRCPSSSTLRKTSPRLSSAGCDTSLPGARVQVTSWLGAGRRQAAGGTELLYPLCIGSRLSGYRLTAVYMCPSEVRAESNFIDHACFTYELPKLPHLLVLLPGLCGLVINLLQLLQDVLDDRRRPHAHIGLQEWCRAQNVLKNLWHDHTVSHAHNKAGKGGRPSTCKIFGFARVSTGKPPSSTSTIPALAKEVVSLHDAHDRAGNVVERSCNRMRKRG